MALILAVLVLPLKALSQFNNGSDSSTSEDTNKQLVVEDQQLEPEEAVIYLEADNYIAEQLYEEWKKEQERKRLLDISLKKVSSKQSLGYNPCSCVSFAKFITGYNNPVGNARNWPKNVSLPFIGGVVVTNESRSGHVAVITDINFVTNEIIITETNYRHCQKGTRTLNINNPIILGYWKE